jgi:hypothetical protein
MQTRTTLKELFELLEEYAPSWYSEEHHNRAVHALAQSADPESIAGPSRNGRSSRRSDSIGADHIQSNKGTRRAPLISRKA